jgi:hypothetical protein
VKPTSTRVGTPKRPAWRNGKPRFNESGPRLSLSDAGSRTRSQRRRERSRSKRTAGPPRSRAAEQTADDLEIKARDAERHAQNIDPEGNAR